MTKQTTAITKPEAVQGMTVAQTIKAEDAWVAGMAELRAIGEGAVREAAARYASASWGDKAALARRAGWDPYYLSNVTSSLLPFANIHAGVNITLSQASELAPLMRALPTEATRLLAVAQEHNWTRGQLRTEAQTILHPATTTVHPTAPAPSARLMSDFDRKVLDLTAHADQLPSIPGGTASVERLIESLGRLLDRHAVALAAYKKGGGK